MHGTSSADISVSIFLKNGMWFWRTQYILQEDVMLSLTTGLLQETKKEGMGGKKRGDTLAKFTPKI